MFIVYSGQLGFRYFVVLEYSFQLYNLLKYNQSLKMYVLFSDSFTPFHNNAYTKHLNRTEHIIYLKIDLSMCFHKYTSNNGAQCCVAAKSKTNVLANNYCVFGLLLLHSKTTMIMYFYCNLLKQFSERNVMDLLHRLNSIMTYYLLTVGIYAMLGVNLGLLSPQIRV